MNLELIRTALGWCTLINMGFIVVWWLSLTFCSGMIHRMHGRFFRVSREQFDAIHYSLIGIFKLGVLLFNAVPWLALHIVQ
jgi:hypothetical protein